MSFVRNCWYVALWSEDLHSGAIENRIILSEPIVFYRDQRGQPVALFDICPHRFAPLSKGRLLPGGGIACGYHGLEFGADGICIRNPHGDRIPNRAQVKRYPLVEQDSLIWIWMGDQTPDPTLIPRYDFLDPVNGYTVTNRETLTMPCDYRLIVDNLLDLSHINFLHDGILGHADAPRADISVATGDRWVEVTRISRDLPVPALFAMLLNDGSERGDLWNTIRWDLAGCLKNDALVCPVGADRNDGDGIFGAHLLTPVTEETTLYHIAAARQKTARAGAETSEEVRQRLGELRRFAFEMQDQPMITAQAEIMRKYPEATHHPVFLEIDTGPAQAQAIIKRHIAAENGPA
ncbi:aromatic ring-hydroxylating dioxygenase subunit alpha [Sphingomonas sp. C8-2]|jgi:vanillate O-demethylase monooxygenase subunit|nr:aromatic ring-hydroxylating dioxygenase subunit alpha [Sphingomonas sp. C8-2]